MTLLINKTDIENYRSTTINVQEALINPFINDAQNEDLRKMLGNAFYFDLIKNKEEAAYTELLEGKTFLIDAIEFQFEGIKAILSDLTYARFIIHGAFHITAFGFVEKSNQDSTPVATSHRRDIKTMSLQSAYSKFEMLKMYLNENTDTFKLWNCHRTPTKRIRKV